MFKKFCQYLEDAADNTYRRYSNFEQFLACIAIIVVGIFATVLAIMAILLFVVKTGWYSIPIVLVGTVGASFYNFWKRSKND